MQKWAQACKTNPLIALISLPLILVLSLFTALILFLKRDPKWKDCI